MPNNSSAAFALPIGFVSPSMEVLPVPEVRMVKCKPGQGKLNRLISKAQVVISGHGHSGNRFKRNYDLGTAGYTCAGCHAIAVIDINSKIMVGEALTDACTAITTEVSNGQN